MGGLNTTCLQASPARSAARCHQPTDSEMAKVTSDPPTADLRGRIPPVFSLTFPRPSAAAIMLHGWPLAALAARTSVFPLRSVCPATSQLPRPIRLTEPHGTSVSELTLPT